MTRRELFALVPMIIWALIGFAAVAKADHDPDPYPSVEECQEILDSGPEEYWWKTPGWHGKDWLCEGLRIDIYSRAVFENRRDFFLEDYPEDPRGHETWAEWQEWRGEIDRSWLVHWGELDEPKWWGVAEGDNRG